MQTIFRLHLFGELLDHFRILNIATLGGNRHQQMMAHQPGDQLGFARVKAVKLGEFQYVLRAENRMVAAAPFGDIVKEGGDKDQLRMRQARPQFHAQRMAATGLFFGEALKLQQHADGVFINGIGVKQIELHLADNMRPLRHIGPQHAMAVHRQQPAAYRALMAQHTEEQGPRFRNVAKRLRQMTAGVAQMAKRGGVNAGDAAVAHHRIEHAQNGLRFTDKQRVIAQIDKRAAQLKIIINRSRLLILGERENRFFEQLDQHLVQLAHPTGDAEEILHHMLNRLVAFAFIAQTAGDAELPVEQQAIIVAVELKM